MTSQVLPAPLPEGKGGDGSAPLQYHTPGNLPCEWGPKPGSDGAPTDCPWSASDPKGTWVCGCGQVKYHVRLMNQPYVACYCDDCHNAVAIALEKSGGKHNHFFDKVLQ